MLSQEKKQKSEKNEDKGNDPPKIINADKYFSAPVSTKEKGPLNKFKFQERVNKTGKLQISEEDKENKEKLNDDLNSQEPTEKNAKEC